MRGPLPGLMTLLPLCAVAWAEPGVPPKAPSPESRGWALVVVGGTEDDQAFARAAFGWRQGSGLDPDQMKRGLEGVKATDRFRGVELRSEPGPSGGTLRLLLDPWPELASWSWTGSGSPDLHKDLLWEMKKGLRVGELRLGRWKELVETRMKARGYPNCGVTFRRHDGGTRLEVELQPGTPALVKRFEVEGDPGRYGAEGLRRRAGLVMGRTLWTEGFARQALANLRSRFLKDRHYEWQAEFLWEPSQGLLRLRVNPGPVVQLRKEGDGLSPWTRIEDLVPLSRADRYVPELLDEGSRRILRRLSEEGYLEAKVVHRREILEGTPEHPSRVRITYRVEAGRRFYLAGAQFERNGDIPEATLSKSLEIPSRWFGLRRAPASPEALESVDAQLRSFYALRGYPEFDVRRRLEGPPERSRIIFSLREGNALKLQSLVLVVPRGGAWNGDALAESLGFLLSENPLFYPNPGGGKGLTAGRNHLGPMKGLLKEDPYVPEMEGRVFRLEPDKPVPLVKAHLAEVLTVLRQRLAALGVRQPLERLTLQPGDEGAVVRIEVPIQPINQVQRLVVQGADRTRARAILREAGLEPGMSLDSGRIVKAQAQLSNLDVFQRLGIEDLSQTQGTSDGAGEQLWREGDLRLQLEERSPWVFSSGFGYDKVQGYYLLMGVQRLNLDGMGRSLDFNLRAGDGTLDSEKLRKWFPTGETPRSVDSYSIGYNDPWFAPGFLEEFMHSRTQFRMEGAYIQERRSVYLLHRRRILDSLEWKPWAGYRLQAGYRFERVDTRPASSQIQDDELSTVAGYPAQSIISAPYLQVVRDTRDNPLDPTRGQFAIARLDLAAQSLGTSSNSSFAKLDVRQQWNWGLGHRARKGIFTLGLRLGVAYPTARTSEDFPLSERFFAGGPGTHRGVEPDGLGLQRQIPLRDPASFAYLRDPSGNVRTQDVALGGQMLVLGNLDYRFPLIGRYVWAECFLDTGQVYASVRGTEGTPAKFPPLRTALGAGLIFKIGIPIKLEYGADVRRILGRPRSEEDRKTELKSLLISAGFQF